MAINKKAARSKPRNGGGGGGAAARENIILRVNDPKKDINQDGDAVTITGTVMSGKHKGKEVTATADTYTNERMTTSADGRIRKYLEKSLEKLQKGADLKIEGFMPKGDGFQFGFINSFSRNRMARDMEEMGEDGKPVRKPQDHSIYDAYVKVQDEFTRKTADGDEYAGRNVDVYRPDLSVGLSRPDSDAVWAQNREMVQEILSQLADQRDELMEVPEYADFIKRAEDFDNLNALERFGVLFDANNLTEDLQAIPNNGVSTVMRCFFLTDDEEAGIKANDAMIGYLKGGKVKEEDGSYRPVWFAEAVERTLNAYEWDEDKRWSMDDFREKGIDELMETVASEDDEGRPVYAGGKIDATSVQILSHLQSQDALQPESQAELMIDTLPTVRYGMGGDTLQNGDKIAEPFNLMGEPKGENGKQYATKVIAPAHVALQTRMRENDDGDKVFTDSSFVTDVVPVREIRAGGRNRVIGDVFSVTTIPTAHTDAVPELKGTLEDRVEKTVARFDQRNWGKNKSQENDKDNDADNDYEGEGQSPGMN